MKLEARFLGLCIMATVGTLAAPATAQEGETPETRIHVEEYPNGTVYVNQDDGRYLWTKDGNERIDCNERMKECKEHLADAVDSGEPVITDMSAAAPQSRIDQILRKRPASGKKLKAQISDLTKPKR